MRQPPIGDDRKGCGKVIKYLIGASGNYLINVLKFLVADSSGFVASC